MIHLRNPDEATMRLTVSRILSTVRNRTALAQTLNINRTTLYKWEHGETWPRVPVLSRLCQALGVQLRIDLGPEIDDDDDVNAKLDRILDLLEGR